ncbi:GIY-YIG nuclease family protein [Enterobacteriaceae bacterium H4N4]|uniref:GIY-YIG nuclease family protein n=1 Tax=Silvania confinis TaxID=2926470 RepID=A0A9J6QC20_9ENTR|nr:GIY-YIG nuclease family protein [Silvania confinis]MCU6667803.1 GIY-YIG nuclease family protein [Silvania confinis]
MDNPSFLYLLLFPAKKMMKVGKANNIYNRVQSLRRFWGEVDYEHSYRIALPQSEVFKLEKMLHFLLAKYQTGIDAGDGYTELFYIEALEPAIKHIHYVIEHDVINAQLQQGIEKPQISAGKSAAHRHRKMKKQSDAMISNLIRVTEQFSRINRLLLILLFKQHRLRYQYDIEENTVLFRIADNRTDQGETLKIMRMFSFFIEDFRYTGGTNYCSGACNKGTITQYTVQLISTDHDAHPLVAYLASQSERLFNKLPSRSSLLTEDLPILESGRILREILHSEGEA